MSQLVRVLHVIHGMDCGGAENMIMNLYRNIDRNKVQFDFMVHTEKHCFFDDEIEKLGGNIYTVPYYNVKNGMDYRECVEKVFINHPEISIVHGHLGSCAHIYLRIAKSHGCYTIAHSHNGKPSFSIKAVCYKLFNYHVRNRADFFMACSYNAGYYRYGKKIVLDKKRFKVLNNAIDVSKYVFSEQKRKMIRSEFSIADETFLVGNVGRFNKQKNHDFLLDIFYEIVQRNSDSILMLVGEGSLENKIRNKIEKLHLTDKVIFTGVRNDVAQMMSAFDVFLFPSLYEGLGIVAVEAQAAGMHTICSNVLPEEAKVTKLLEYCSLSDGPKLWADKVLQYNNHYARENMSAQIIEKEYDIGQTALDIQRFYDGIGRSR